MIRKSLSLKFLMYATAAGVLLILLLMAVSTRLLLGRAFKAYEVNSQFQRLYQISEAMRQREKDFQLYDVISNTFYETGNSPFLGQYTELRQQASEALALLAQEELVRSAYLDRELQLLGQGIEQQTEAFAKLVLLTRQKGFKNHGLEGQMRGLVHTIETKIDSMDRAQDLRVAMLTLRRHEKDYLLRRDMRYLELFSEQILFSKALLRQEAAWRDPLAISQLNNLFELYETVFRDLVDKDRQIGVTSDAGQRARVERLGLQVGGALTRMAQVVQESTRGEIERSTRGLFWMLALFTLAITALLLRNAAYLDSSIRFVQKKVDRLAKGDTQQSIVIQKQDEIGQMLGKIRELSESLGLRAAFANEIAQGNFQADFKPLGKQDTLGLALVDMRDKLEQNRLAKLRQDEREAQERWAAESLARLGDLLNQSFTALEPFASALVFFLAKLIDVQQMGLYLAEPEREQIRLLACVAYNHEQLDGQTLAPGEGLVGMCIEEGKRLVFTELPPNYLTIRSGLGDTPPSHLALVPLRSRDKILGALEMASLKPLPSHHLDFLDRASDNISRSLANFMANLRTQDLLKASKEQAHLLSSQEEELRQNLEELQATQEEAQHREELLRAEIRRLKAELAKRPA